MPSTRNTPPPADAPPVPDSGIPIPEAVARAELMGHTVEWDPPAGITAARRWTCACGATALDYRGNIYGSAITSRCPKENP